MEWTQYTPPRNAVTNGRLTSSTTGAPIIANMLITASPTTRIALIPSVVGALRSRLRVRRKGAPSEVDALDWLAMMLLPILLADLAAHPDVE